VCLWPSAASPHWLELPTCGLGVLDTHAGDTDLELPCLESPHDEVSSGTSMESRPGDTRPQERALEMWELAWWMAGWWVLYDRPLLTLT
jgi:hypothetical protein